MITGPAKVDATEFSTPRPSVVATRATTASTPLAPINASHSFLCAP